MEEKGIVIKGSDRRIRLVGDLRRLLTAVLDKKKSHLEILHTFLIRTQNMHHPEIEKENMQWTQLMTLALG
jgi:hypothetical protein